MDKPRPARREILPYHYRFNDDTGIIFQINRHSPTTTPVFDMHLPLELGIVLSGNMVYSSADETISLKRGCIWMVRSLKPHGRHVKKGSLQAAVFIVKPDFFHRSSLLGIEKEFLIAPFYKNTPQSAGISDEEFAILAERLGMSLSISSQDKRIRSGMIQICFLQILLLAIGKMEHAPGPQSDTCLYDQLAPAFKMVYESTGLVQLPQAAKACSISPTHFSRLFMKATDISFSKFALRYRLTRVADDLMNSLLSIDELSDKWGFHSKSHLAHSFKQHYMCTPGEFRRSAAS